MKVFDPRTLQVTNIYTPEQSARRAKQHARHESQAATLDDLHSRCKQLCLRSTPAQLRAYAKQMCQTRRAA